MGQTCTAMVDNIVGQHMVSREDESGLGQWTYVCIAGKDKQSASIITGYWLCIQLNPGSGMVNAQQKCLLTIWGKPNAEVRKEWDSNMLTLVRK
eukprot:7020759-Ditylum_brightwellii.AAC.1